MRRCRHERTVYGTGIVDFVGSSSFSRMKKSHLQFLCFYELSAEYSLEVRNLPHGALKLAFRSSGLFVDRGAF